METSLRTLQLCILDIALEFQRICNKHQLVHFLIGGTLLGAVRHSGFIPWDDDMDVGMLRADYEKFLSICQSELADGLFLQTFKTDKYYAHGFAKIRINGTKLIEDYAKKSQQHNGIYLDIFPYDAMPDKKFEQKFHYLMFKCVKWAALGKTDYSFVECKKRRFSYFMSSILFFIKKEPLLNILTKICTLFNKSFGKYYVNMFGAYNYNEYTDKKNLEILDQLLFEGYKFSVPSNYKQLLENMYGDYWKLPPVETRGKQHIMVQVDIGSYKVKNTAK